MALISRTWRLSCDFNFDDERMASQDQILANKRIDRVAILNPIVLTFNLALLYLLLSTGGRCDDTLVFDLDAFLPRITRTVL